MLSKCFSLHSSERTRRQILYWATSWVQTRGMNVCFFHYILLFFIHLITIKCLYIYVVWTKVVLFSMRKMEECFRKEYLSLLIIYPKKYLLGICWMPNCDLCSVALENKQKIISLMTNDPEMMIVSSNRKKVWKNDSNLKPQERV